MFAIIDFAARKGLGAQPSAHSPSGAAGDSAPERARHVESAACRCDVPGHRNAPRQKAPRACTKAPATPASTNRPLAPGFDSVAARFRWAPLA
jgi:hypothetical protein